MKSITENGNTTKRVRDKPYPTKWTCSLYNNIRKNKKIMASEWSSHRINEKGNQWWRSKSRMVVSFTRVNILIRICLLKVKRNIGWELKQRCHSPHSFVLMIRT